MPQQYRGRDAVNTSSIRGSVRETVHAVLTLLIEPDLKLFGTEHRYRFFLAVVKTTDVLQEVLRKNEWDPSADTVQKILLRPCFDILYL